MDTKLGAFMQAVGFGDNLDGSFFRRYKGVQQWIECITIMFEPRWRLRRTEATARCKTDWMDHEIFKYNTEENDGV